MKAAGNEQGILLYKIILCRHKSKIADDRKLIESEEYQPGKVCVFHVSTSVLFHCTVVSL